MNVRCYNIVKIAIEYIIQEIVIIVDYVLV